MNSALCYNGAMKLAALLLATTFAIAQTPTIEQSLNLKSVQSARISPDGTRVAYEVQEAEWKDNFFKTEIRVADLATGQHFQLTNSKKSSNSAAWSPDGQRIGFISDRDGKRQIW